MKDFEALADRYIAVWNETDAERRRALIGGTFAEGATYVDALMAGEGTAGIDAMIEAVQARFPGHRFRRKGAVDGHNDRMRFSWELAPEGGDAFIDGTDFAVVIDGKLFSITGFLDRAPAG